MWVLFNNGVDMSEAPSGHDAMTARLRRFAARVRPVHLLAAGGAVVLVGMAGLQAVALPGPRPLVDGDRLMIEVVRPVEPEILPGSVMDVGELVDGFQGVPSAPVMETVAYAAYDDEEDWRAPPEPAPWPHRRTGEAVVETSLPQPEPSANRSVRDRWFGFDAPRRDYRAEREARRARLESRAWEGDRERDRAYDHQGRDDPDRGGEDRWREPPDPRDDVWPTDRRD